MTSGAKSFLRGHRIKRKRGQWVYQDTEEPTINNPRPCGACGSPDTLEGHDSCLGVLPGVMNACCGHGVKSMAYLQFTNGSRLSGNTAIQKIKYLLEERKDKVSNE